VSSYLITGGAGFIGSNLARELILRGNQVLIIDDLSQGKLENIPPGANFHHFNLKERPNFFQLAENSFDCIFHLAGQSSGEKSFRDPLTDVQSNLVSTYNVIDLAKEMGVPKVVFASSMAVYGNQANIPLLETSQAHPRTPYGNHKLASENALRIFSDTAEVSVSVARLFNVYGPGQDLSNKYQGMLSIYLAFLLNDETLIVKGSPERVRDFVYVGDVVNALLLLSEDTEVAFEILNVCTGRGITVSELIGMLRLGFPNFSREIKDIEGTPGDQFRVVGSPELFLNNYGWSPSIVLEEGIEILFSEYGSGRLK